MVSNLLISSLVVASYFSANCALSADSDIRKVFIRSLSYDTTPDTVRSAFTKFGRIEDLHMKVDSSTGRSNGMATITFSSPADASKAVRNAPQKIDGRQVYVQLSNQQTQQNQRQQQQQPQQPQQQQQQMMAQAGMQAALIPGMMPMSMAQMNMPMGMGMTSPMNMMGMPMNYGMGGTYSMHM